MPLAAISVFRIVDLMVSFVRRARGVAGVELVVAPGAACGGESAVDSDRSLGTGAGIRGSGLICPVPGGSTRSSPHWPASVNGRRRLPAK